MFVCPQRIMRRYHRRTAESLLPGSAACAAQNVEPAMAVAASAVCLRNSRRVGRSNIGLYVFRGEGGGVNAPSQPELRWQCVKSSEDRRLPIGDTADYQSALRGLREHCGPGK